MLTALFGIGTAVFFGAADFLGGRAAQQISAIRATALSAAAGLVVLLIALPLLGGTWSVGALTWGILAGIVAACTVALLYASLAIGPMSILAPLLGVVAAVVPAIYGLLRGEQLGITGYIGVGVALLAVVLVGFVPHREAVRPSLPGLVLAVLAGTAMGTGIIVLDSTPADSGILPLIIGRVASILIMTAVILAAAARSRDLASGWAGGSRFALAGGLFAAAADVFLLSGVRTGDVTVIGVLAALCAAVTVVLAAVIRRERLAPPQVVGLVLALVAAALFTLA